MANHSLEHMADPSSGVAVPAGFNFPYFLKNKDAEEVKIPIGCFKRLVNVELERPQRERERERKRAGKYSATIQLLQGNCLKWGVIEQSNRAKQPSKAWDEVFERGLLRSISANASGVCGRV
jgi:hypothetical protein